MLVKPTDQSLVLCFFDFGLLDLNDSRQTFFRLTLKQSTCDRFLAQVSDGQVTQQEKQADGRQIKRISCQKDTTD